MKLWELANETMDLQWDCICLSETRAGDGDTILHGGHRLLSSLNGETYAGVALLVHSRWSGNIINSGFIGGRIIWADISMGKYTFRYISVYAPHAGYPIGLFEELMGNLRSTVADGQLKDYKCILGGDFNIIPSAEDVYNVKSFEDDALYRLEIRKKLREIINLGFHDAYRHIHGDKEGYTFWDYMRGAWQKNNGMRIDHFLVSNSLIDQIKSININKDPRGREKPSDHTPIEIKLA